MRPLLTFSPENPLLRTLNGNNLIIKTPSLEQVPGINRVPFLAYNFSAAAVLFLEHQMGSQTDQHPNLSPAASPLCDLSPILFICKVGIVIPTFQGALKMKWNEMTNMNAPNIRTTDQQMSADSVEFIELTLRWEQLIFIELSLHVPGPWLSTLHVFSHLFLMTTYEAISIIIPSL